MAAIRLRRRLIHTIMRWLGWRKGRYVTWASYDRPDVAFQPRLSVWDVQPFSQNSRTATVPKVFQIGLCGVVEADLELFATVGVWDFWENGCIKANAHRKLASRQTEHRWEVAAYLAAVNLEGLEK